MPQTTGAYGRSHGLVRLAATYTGTWNDISGSISGIDGSQERMVDGAFTLDGDTKILAPGKLDAGTMSLRGVVTETAAEAHVLLRGQHQSTTARGQVFLQVWPRNTAGTDVMYRTPQTKPAYITSLTYFQLTADEAGPMMFEAEIAYSELQVTTANNTAGGSGT